MNYINTLKYFDRLETVGIKLGLDNMKRLMRLSGNPDKKLRFIHIAGTNGKGSTARFIAGILKAAGYRTGLYTSPHLEKVEERFQIKEACISQSRLAGLAAYYRSLIKKEKDFSPTYFEVTTAIAIKYFSEEKVDIGVMEVGMGGRLDATNVIKPEVCVITSISHDHMQYLGTGLSDIASEKFSIIKPEIPVVAFLEQRPLREKLKGICRKGKNPLIFVGEDIKYKLHKADLKGQIFTLRVNPEPEAQGPGLHLTRFMARVKLLGEHQLVNASLAFGTAGILSQRGFNITSRHIKEGLGKTTWPGRFEILKNRPYIVLDGAHNPDAIKKLKEALRYYFPDKRIVLVLAIMSDKDWPGIVKIISPSARLVLTCRIDSDRGCPSETLAEEVRKFNRNVIRCRSVGEAISTALDKSREKDVICVAGSLYLAGEARRKLKMQNVKHRSVKLKAKN